MSLTSAWNLQGARTKQVRPWLATWLPKRRESLDSPVASVMPFLGEWKRLLQLGHRAYSLAALLAIAVAPLSANAAGSFGNYVSGVAFGANSSQCVKDCTRRFNECMDRKNSDKAFCEQQRKACIRACESRTKDERDSPRCVKDCVRKFNDCMDRRSSDKSFCKQQRSACLKVCESTRKH